MGSRKRSRLRWCLSKRNLGKADDVVDNEVVNELRSFLDAVGVDYQIIEHPNVDGTHSDSAAMVHRVEASSIVKTLVIANEESEFCVAIVPGDKRADFHKLSNHFRGREKRLATAEEVYRLTGCTRGGIPPVLHKLVVPVVVDKTLLEKEFVYGSAGTPNHGLRIGPADVVRINHAIVADIVE